MNEPTPKLVLHLGQQMIDVADEIDFRMDLLGIVVHQDEVSGKWMVNGPSNFLVQRLADCLTRLQYKEGTP